MREVLFRLKSCWYDVDEFFWDDDHFFYRLALNEWPDLLGGFSGGFNLGRRGVGGDFDDVAELAVNLDGDLQGVFDEQRQIEAWPGGVTQCRL